MPNPATLTLNASSETTTPPSSSSSGATRRVTPLISDAHEALTAEAVPLLLPPRDIDELEGSLLLLPVARQVHDDDDHPAGVVNAMAAVPTHFFEYDEATMAAEQQPQQQQQHHHADVQIAYHIPTFPTPDDRRRYAHPNAGEATSPDDELTIRQAERMGVILAEEEREAIRNANRRVFAHNYHEEKSVQVANEIAKRRDREGLQVRQPPTPAPVPLVQQQQQFQERAGFHPPDDASRLGNDRKEEKEEGEGHRDGHRLGAGYQVREYSVDDVYDPKEYDVKEYKSLYDR